MKALILVMILYIFNGSLCLGVTGIIGVLDTYSSLELLIATANTVELHNSQHFPFKVLQFLRSAHALSPSRAVLVE